VPSVRHLTGDRPLLAMLLLAALLAKALVPAGWMPVFANGAISLQLCGGWTPAPAAHHAAQAHGQQAPHHAATAPSEDGGDDAQPTADQPCAFAAAALPWTPADASAPLPPPFFVPVVRRLAAAIGVGRGLAAPPPPSTGPPLLS
jgi:hypothetical protein